LVFGCATAAPEVRPAPVVLAQRCRTGPFCLTGEIDDQYATAVEGARCVVLGASGESTVSSSNHQGVFFMDGLVALPREARFEKAGFVAQTVPVLPAVAGVSARLYVILHQIDRNECTCEPSALISGREPCPADACSSSHFDNIVPETPPTADPPPAPADTPPAPPPP
jgi:hypothetical protein